eukprot:tig00021070_g17862.t1
MAELVADTDAAFVALVRRLAEDRCPYPPPRGQPPLDPYPRPAPPQRLLRVFGEAGRLGALLAASFEFLVAHHATLAADRHPARPATPLRVRPAPPRPAPPRRGPPARVTAI